MPVLPIRGISVFPGTMLTFDVERPASKKALDAAMESDQIIFLTAQKDPSVAQPKDEEVYHMGTTRKEGKLLSAGGRVLMVVGRGATLAEAKAMAEKGCATIECEELFYRKDIGHKVLN